MHPQGTHNRGLLFYLRSMQIISQRQTSESLNDFHKKKETKEIRTHFSRLKEKKQQS